jgi:iron complex outermembrane receptor protein
MNNLLRKLLIGGSTVALAAVMPASAAFAQDQNDKNDIEQVIVSASRITIAGYSQPTPVTVIGAAQLEQDANSNIMDSLRALPQIQANPSYLSSNSDQGSQGTGGTNFANLRNLGTTRTLVLFDSQRMVSATAATNVDITTLPASVVSRVDVVTGGASAAWGSDAVAGVVNFVINKNITGFHATVSGGDTSDGRVRDFFTEANWGDDIAGGRGHIELAGSAHLRPDYEMLTDENYFKGSYWVSNPAYAAGNGQPQLIVATNVGEANANSGGIINSSPAGVAGPGVTPAAANALRGIEFLTNGTPQLVNYGNLTQGTLSNGGSLSDRDGQQSFNAITQPINAYSFFGFGRYKLTDTIQLSVQGNFGYDTDKGMNVAAPQTALVIKSDNAYIPASVRAAMQAGGIASFTMGTLNTNNWNPYTANGANFSQMEGSLAPAVYVNRRDVWRGVFTLEGELGDDWSWNAYIQHSASRISTHDLSVPILSNLANAEDAVTVTTANRGTSGLPLGSIACRSTLTGTQVISPTTVNVVAQPGCVPIDVFGIGVASQAALNYVTGAAQPMAAVAAGTIPLPASSSFTSPYSQAFGAQTNSLDYLHQSLQQDVFSASIQGTLPWELPAGKIAIAGGGEYRHQLGVVSGPYLAYLLGYGQGNTAFIPPSQYNVVEGFLEVDAPILKDNVVNSLDVSLAGRMTSYSTSGLVETWKLGATSQVTEDFKLRATYSVDIRAPQLSELFSTGISGSTQVVDPKTQQTLFVFSQSPGNPNLQPEVAHTVSAGIVLTPTFIPSLSLSADWYNINLKGVVGSLTAATILAQCNSQLASLINIGQNGNPNDALCTHLTFNGPNGALSFINTGVINLTSETTSGLDLQANYSMDFWDGTLAWSALANLNDETTVVTPGTASTDAAGSGGIPKWRGILQATYDTGPYSVTAMGRWFGTSVFSTNGNTGNRASAANALLYDPAHFEIPVVAYLDLRASYKWNDNIQFFAAIDNTLDTPPPLVAPTLSSLNAGGSPFDNTQSSVYDQLGRNFRIGVRFNY